MTKWWKHIAAAGVAMAVLGAGMTTTPAFADPVKDRQTTMKNISKANKALQQAAKAKDPAAAKAAAMTLLAHAEKVEAMFPKGSGEGYGKTTRAKPEIWTDWEKFQAASKDLEEATRKVANGDLGAAADVGKSCGGCHKAFRGPKLKS